MTRIPPVVPYVNYHPHHMTSSTVQAAGRSCNTGNKQPAASAAGSSRWIPTREQTMALEGLYQSGTKSLTAQQIRLVTARLRHYGRIEGKNVFYWFQNHRARERQKKRRELMTMYQRRRQTLTTVNSISGLPLLQQSPGVDFVGCLEVEKQNKWTVLPNCFTVLSDKDQESSSVVPERLLMMSMVKGNNTSRNNNHVDLHHCYDHCNDAAMHRVLTTAPKKEEEGDQVDDEEAESRVAQTLELFPLKSDNLN